MYTFLWLISGFTGCLMSWWWSLRFDIHLDQVYPTTAPDFHGWCPTPRAILGFFMFTWFGPLVLLFGCIGAFVVWFQIQKPNPNSWWKRPICKRGDK